ncbi:YhjD/YihY/BrkB family envelope integrity protein [Micromonospora sp. NPDC049559]|uniref:YihY/virulence factor BrkB family protein n=1 Tax=Micromonospora sp. NPDC049559 TaxID=3155923 RepID=UPI003438047D
MNVFDRIEAAIDRPVSALRRRYRRFDHLWRALIRYNEVLGGRLAAAMAYYGFFAVFALGLVGYWIFAAVLEQNDAVNHAVSGFLEQHLPFLDPVEIQQGSGRVGAIGLVLLAFTGIGWVEAIRTSQRLIYGFEQHPGYIVIRQLLDLAVLVFLFVLLGVSIGAVDALESLLAWMLGARSLGASISSWILSQLVNMVIAAALLAVVPRLRMSARRLLAPVLVVSLGITLLNSVGRYYVMRWERNPAYTVVAGAVGVLLYLYLLNQLLLFGAALAATSRHGRVVDLADRNATPPPPPGGPPR